MGSPACPPGFRRSPHLTFETAGEWSTLFPLLAFPLGLLLSLTIPDPGGFPAIGFLRTSPLVSGSTHRRTWSPESPIINVDPLRKALAGSLGVDPGSLPWLPCALTVRPGPQKFCGYIMRWGDFSGRIKSSRSTLASTFSQKRFSFFLLKAPQSVRVFYLSIPDCGGPQHPTQQSL